MIKIPTGNANRTPSILSKIPPWPGRNDPVSLIFAFLLKIEIIKSPTCDIDDISNITKNILESNNIISP